MDGWITRTHRYTYKAVFTSWLLYASKAAESKRRYKICTDRWLGHILREWHEESAVQKSLKLAALERWILTSRSKIQVPHRRLTYVLGICIRIYDVYEYMSVCVYICIHTHEYVYTCHVLYMCACM